MIIIKFPSLKNTYYKYDKKIYKEFEKKKKENELKYPTIQEKIEYLYCNKAILSAKASATWIWNVISVILAIASIIAGNVEDSSCFATIWLMAMIIIGVLGIYRNEQLREINVKIVCIDKWINELSPPTKSTIKIKKSIIHKKTSFNMN